MTYQEFKELDMDKMEKEEAFKIFREYIWDLQMENMRLKRHLEKKKSVA